MFRRHQIDPDPPQASPSSLRSAVADSAWAAQDRARSGLANAARESADWAGWALKRGLIWPIADRTDGLSGPLRAAALGAMVLIAAAAGVAGLLWAAPDGGKATTAQAPAATAEPVAVTKAAAKDPVPAEPTLHGAPPRFKPAAGSAKPNSGKSSKPSGSSSSSANSAKPADSAASPASNSHPSTATTFSTASSSNAKTAAANGPVAGPQAIDVARDFSKAFVRYETGDDGDVVRKAFGATATEPLAKALLRRPPRLPANVKVPKAKVLNIVPGPSHDGVYTVSVSLLRVGATSELRLDLQQQGKKKKRWLVTNVLG